MNTISLLCAEPLPLPGGLWSSLINWFHSGIGNFGWTILVLTIVIKLITSPLEFWTKYNTKKQSLIQQKCAPQIAKIKKKFGANQDAVRIQTNALYKKEGLNAGVGCVVTLFHLVLSLVIFLTFYSSLRANSAYQAINQYEILETTFEEKCYDALILKDQNGEIEDFVIYNEDAEIARKNVETFVEKYAHGRNLVAAQSEQSEDDETEETMTDAEYIAFYNKYNELFEELKATYSEDENYPQTESVYTALVEKNAEIEDYDITDSEKAEDFVKNYIKATEVVENQECINLFNKNSDAMTDVQTEAEQAVLEKWQEIKSSWLWIANIWVSDSTTRPFLTYEGLVSIANSGGSVYKNYVTNIDNASFNYIANLINTKGTRTHNGYYILAILAAGATFMAQFIGEAHTKLKNKKAKSLANATMADSMNSSMKLMKFILPVIMILFVLRSSASFGIYIVTSNISTILFGEIMNLLVNKLTGKKQKEVEEALEKEANRLIKKGKMQEKK